MIQGPPDPGTDLLQPEFLALAWSAHQGDAASIDVLLDAFLASARPFIWNADGRSREELRSAAVNQVRLDLLERELLFAIPFERLTTRTFAAREVCVFNPLTGETYANIHELDGPHEDLLDLRLMTSQRDELPPAHVAKPRVEDLLFVDLRLSHDLSMVPMIQVEERARERREARDGAVAALERLARETWTLPPTKYHYPRERRSEGRGGFGVPLGLRAKLKPWER